MAMLAMKDSGTGTIILTRALRPLRCTGTRGVIALSSERMSIRGEFEDCRGSFRISAKIGPWRPDIWKGRPLAQCHAPFQFEKPRSEIFA